MTVSVKGHDRAVAALKKKGTLGEVPEEPPIPKGIPEKVKVIYQGRLRISLEAIDFFLAKVFYIIRNKQGGEGLRSQPLLFCLGWSLI